MSRGGLWQYVGTRGEYDTNANLFSKILEVCPLVSLSATVTFF